MKTFQYRCEYGLLRWLQKILNRLSIRRVSDFGARCGDWFYKAGIRKSVTVTNLQQAGVAADGKEASALARTVYQNLGRTFFELLTLRRIELIEGRDYSIHWPEGFAESIRHGAIFISAHLGNWELMGKILVRHGLPLAVVVRRQHNPWVDRLINEEREACGLKIIYDDEGQKLRNGIEAGYCIGLLADQDFGHNTVPLNFFGKPCFAPLGPEYLAAKYHLPMFMCLAFRHDRYRHVFRIEPLKNHYPDTHRGLTQSYTQAIEAAVRAFPEQWLWAHKRWKDHS